MSARTRTAAVLLAVPAALAFSACSLLTPSLTADQLETEIKSTLQSQANITAESVECPGDLKGEVGNTTECSVSANGKMIKVKITVTSVEDRTIKFDIDET